MGIAEISSQTEHLHDQSYDLIKAHTRIDFNHHKLSFNDELNTNALITYETVANKDIAQCSYETWSILLLLALEKVAIDENHIDLGKLALTAIQKIMHYHSQNIDPNIKVWLDDLFKGFILF